MITSPRATDFPSDPAAYVEELALDYLRLAATQPKRIGLRDRKLTATATAEYEGRFLIELIQNAYDAHPARRDDGRILVDFDPGDGEFGTLWVGNAGNPFSASNVTAIAEIANSDKRPDQGVGNKGVGFRAVLRISEWPEIYSSSSNGASTAFDGFTFGFAHPADLEFLKQKLGELGQLVPKVSPYCVLMPIAHLPVGLESFNSLDLATVIRLPIRSQSAAELVRSEVDWLVKSPRPLLLFLDRIGQLEVRIRQESRVLQERHVKSLARTSLNVELEEVHLEPGGLFLVGRREVDSKRVRDVLTQTVEAGLLDEDWLEWSEPATVSIAAPLNGAGDAGVFYTYLPMDQAESPCASHINAPFITKLARRNLDTSIPINDLYLSEAAEIALDAAVWVRDTALNRAAVVDLAAWEGSMDHMNAAIGKSVHRSVNEVIPTTSKEHPWMALADCQYWAPEGLTTFVPNRLAKLPGIGLVDPTLGALRVARLNTIKRLRHSTDLEPSRDLLASWAESLALEMRRAGLSPATWDGFYGDLATVFARDAPRLVGKKILLDDEGRLREGIGRTSSKGARPATAVFFPPQQGTDISEDAEEASKADIPASLRSRLVYMNRGLTWSERLPSGGRRARPARGFLESAGLVQEFRTETLLDYTKEISSRSKSESVRLDLLIWSYRLVTSMRGSSPASLEALGLKVPTRSGWINATDALFGPEWDREGGLLAALISELGGTVPELMGLQDRFLIGPSAISTYINDIASWVAFLHLIGVKAGLQPMTDSPSAIPPTAGPTLTPRWLASRWGLPARLGDWWATHLESRGHKTIRPETYRVSGAGWRWPGQESFEEMPDAAKRHYSALVLAAIESLQERHRWVTVGRPDGYMRDEQRWPTPLQLFLKESQWMPMSQPGDRHRYVFDVPDLTWHADDADDQPDFVPLLPGEFARRVRSSGDLRSRLIELGLNIWAEPSHGSYLVEFLGSILNANPPSDARAASFKKAYQRAWSDAVSSDRRPFSDYAEEPAWLAVTKSGRLEAVDLRQLPDDFTIYVQDTDETTVTRLIDELGWPFLRMERVGDEVAAALKVQVGERVRRTSAADLKVIVDGEEFVPSLGSELVVSNERNWIRELVLLAYELQPRSPDALFRTEAGQRRLADAIDRIRVKWANSFQLMLGNTLLPPTVRPSRPLPLRDDKAPTLVLAGPAMWDWGTVARISRGLCELASQHTLASYLELVVTKLSASHVPFDQPDDAALAAAFDVDALTIREARAAFQSSMELALYRLTPVIAVYSDPIHAREILERDDLKTAEAIEREIMQFTLPVSPSDLVRMVLEPLSLSETRDRLQIDYRIFNDALTALGPPYQAITNASGQAMAIESWLASNRSYVLGLVGGNFREAFKRYGDLGEYSKLRDLRFIQPDPSWLQDFDLPPEGIIKMRVREAIDALGAVGDSSATGDINALITENRRQFAAVLKERKPIVEAWCVKARVALPEGWEEDQSPTLVAQAEALGVFDFEVLSEDQVIGWLDTLRNWPDGMPRSFRITQLGLTQAEIDSQRTVADQEVAARRLLRTSVSVDGREFILVSNDFDAVSAAILEGITSDFLRSGRNFALTKGFEDGHRTKSGGVGHPGPIERLSDVQRTAIGLAGELAAFAWLKHRYSECNESSWKSKNAGIYLKNGVGDDGLGYDFEVLSGTMRHYFEVKATSSPDKFEFELGESEVKRAQDSGEAYRILYVLNAMSTNRTILQLRNPFTNKGRSAVRMMGTGVRFRFGLI